MVGLAITLFSTLAYTLKFSYLKDLKDLPISKFSLNMFYRLSSLPFIILFFFILDEGLVIPNNNFWMWGTLTLIINVLLSLAQTYIFQKHQFSSVEAFTFIEIVFTTLIGYLFLNEVLLPKQIIRIIIILCASIFVYWKELKLGHFLINLEIASYYLIPATASLFNKIAIQLSSPIIFSLFTTIGLIISFLILGRNNIYRIDNTKINKLLIFIGFLTAFSLIGISYSFKLLPIGIVSTILTLKVFFSLWLSHKKYKEKNLSHKVFASVLAFIGVVILFL